MKAFSKALAAVGAVAIAATALIPTTAAVAAPNGFQWKGNSPYYSNHKGYQNRQPGYRYNNGFWFPPAAFIAGAIIGGALSQSQPSYSYARPQTYSYVYATPHIVWCQQHYRSYNIATDSFTGYDGYVHRCVSPY